MAPDIKGTERYVNAVMHLDGVSGPMQDSPCKEFKGVFPVCRFISGSFSNDSMSDSQKTSDGRVMSTSIIITKSILGLSQLKQLCFKGTTISSASIISYQTVQDSKDEKAKKNILDISNASLVFIKLIDRNDIGILEIIDLLTLENNSKTFDFDESYKKLDKFSLERTFGSTPGTFSSAQNERIRQEVRESNKGILVAIKTSNRASFTTKCTDEIGNPIGDFDTQFG